MIERSDITRYARIIFSHKTGTRQPRLMHPEREWFIIILVFLIIFLTGAVVSVWSYQYYQALPASVSVPSDTIRPTYQRSQVLDIHQRYAERLERYQELINLSPAANSEESTNDTSTDENSDQASETFAELEEAIETESVGDEDPTAWPITPEF